MCSRVPVQYNFHLTAGGGVLCYKYSNGPLESNQLHQSLLDLTPMPYLSVLIPHPKEVNILLDFAPFLHPKNNYFVPSAALLSSSCYRYHCCWCCPHCTRSPRCCCCCCCCVQCLCLHQLMVLQLMVHQLMLRLAHNWQQPKTLFKPILRQPRRITKNIY